MTISLEPREEEGKSLAHHTKETVTEKTDLETRKKKIPILSLLRDIPLEVFQ